MGFPRLNTGVGCYFLLQGIFLIEEYNLCLLHWQVDSLPLSLAPAPLAAAAGVQHLLQTLFHGHQESRLSPPCKDSQVKSRSALYQPVLSAE